MQLDSANLARLQLTLSQAFEPCASLHAAGAILITDYESGLGVGGWGEGGVGVRATGAARRPLCESAWNKDPV